MKRGALPVLALLAALLVWPSAGKRQEAALEAQAREVEAVARKRWQAGEAFTEVGAAEDCTGAYTRKALPELRTCEVIRLPRGFEVSLSTDRAGRTVKFFGPP